MNGIGKDKDKDKDKVTRNGQREAGSRLRVAVVGVGHLGQHHARILAARPDVELVAVADTRPEQAAAIAAKLGTRAVTDFRTLVDCVDAVSIAVPTVHHRAVAAPFLERGIATLIEKPLATSLAEAEALVALARTHSAVLQVGHIERFNPALSALDNLPLRPKYISCERLSTYTFRSTDIGVVLDLMIHDLDLVLSLVPAPVRTVSAVGVSVFGGHEDVASARLEFEDGCVVNLTASRASYAAARKMRLWGTEGYATLDFATRRGTIVRPSDQLRLGHIDLSGVDMSQPAEVKEHLFGKILRVDRVQAEERDQLTLELDDFIHSARQGTRPRVSGVEALRAMRLADHILREINTHEWEGVPEGPVGPHDLPAPLGQAGPGTVAGGIATPALRGPISWRNARARQSSGSTLPPANTSE
jgi:predicted dehydrogenase